EGMVPAVPEVAQRRLHSDSKQPCHVGVEWEPRGPHIEAYRPGPVAGESFGQEGQLMPYQRVPEHVGELVSGGQGNARQVTLPRANEDEIGTGGPLRAAE